MAALVTVASVTARADGGDASEDRWLGPDKVLHCGISAGLAVTFYTAATPLFAARYPPLLLGAAVTLAIGAGKEGYDAVSGGDPSWKDFTWDAIGTVAGLALGYTLDLALRGLGPEHPALGEPEIPAQTRPAVRLDRGLVVVF